MRRMKVVILLGLLGIVSNSGVAQILLNGNTGDELYNTPLLSSWNISIQTMKTLRYNDTTFISFYNSTSQRIGNFYKFQNCSSGSDSISQVEMPDLFKINDFSILGDTLYFCGSVNNSSHSTAFIAYISIDELFSASANQTMDTNNIRYTLFDDIYQDEIYTIKKIETYYDDNGNRVIAGFGDMLYGKPPYRKFQNFQQVLIDPDEYYLEFVMFCTIKEDIILTNQNDYTLGASPIYKEVNDVKMFYFPSDTVGGVYYNKFYDIIQTDNFIDAVFVRHEEAVATGKPILTSVSIAQFDKNSLQCSTYKIDLPETMCFDYGVKAASLENDTIAIVFTYLRNNSDSTISTAIKLNMNDLPDTVITQISLYDPMPFKNQIKDCKYFSPNNKLLVLKSTYINSYSDDYGDVIIDLNMDADCSFPYIANKMAVNQINNNYIRWSNILHSGPMHYSLTGYYFSGYSNSPLYFFDKFMLNSLQQNCYSISNSSVSTGDTVHLSTTTPMVKCAFPKIVVSLIDEGFGMQSIYTNYFSTDVYKAVIKYMARPAVYYDTVTGPICQ